MSLSDKSSFRNAFKNHYDNLSQILYIWDKNSEFDDGKTQTTYQKSFSIDSSDPYEFVVSDSTNYVCNHNHNNSRQCKPDVVKCPIEHVLVIHNTEDSDTKTVFDFQPMSAKATDHTDRHGKNILKFRAEYGVFDANHHDQKYKQEKMKAIEVYHPRYQLMDILRLLKNSIEPYQYPFDPSKNYNGLEIDDVSNRYDKDTSVRMMGRRYIFLSVDYIDKNDVEWETSNDGVKLSDFITQREHEMMVHFYGVPGSNETVDLGNPNVCSMYESDGKRHWTRFKTNAEGISVSEDITLYDCRSNNSNCHDKFELDGPFDRCRRCEDKCDGDDYVSRPCSRNNWYSTHEDEKEYRPKNAIERNGKLCPFDGFGTEIPDDVNDSNDVCWKSDFLIANWDTKCKDHTHFKKNYCAGAPDQDLKMHKPDDYANARYLTANVCNPTVGDMTNLCEWVANVEHSGNISGYPVETYCGCHKKTFVDANKHQYFFNMQGNRSKLDTLKKWSQNATLNDLIYDQAKDEYGIRSTDKGILEQIDTPCWPSCIQLKNHPANATESFLNNVQKGSCAFNGCVNTIESTDNINTNLDNIRQSCSYTSAGDDVEETTDNNTENTNNNTNDTPKNSPTVEDDDEDFLGLTSTQWFIGGGVSSLIMLMCVMMILVLITMM